MLPRIAMPRPARAGSALLALALLVGTAAGARADTTLHLAETATVMAVPDELAASVRAEVTSASAADAQARVNAQVQEALSRARAVAGVTVSTGGYGVWRAGPTPQDRTERWQAVQTVNLSGHDGPSLLKLVGELQQRGLVVSSLGWRLSADASRRAQQEATRKAIAGLRGRVEEAAQLLNLRFDSFKSVRLDSASPHPAMLRAAAPMAMAAAPPPNATPEDVAVTATAEADAELEPR
ncbi:MAG: SIMPL domain-containing protein [Rhodospirillales bacterium]|nr:SIMPL domain-containing protein [Rhodospirillales bacterium]